MPQVGEPSPQPDRPVIGADRSLLYGLAVAVVAIGAFWLLSGQDSERRSISYAAFNRHLAAGEVL
ncbi:MAG: hypothetical protein JRJ58_10965, partial [Deltaproteobacteria bacterium]|nr:hypothetical protein [Deltaproteobacteria bacterium]